MNRHPHVTGVILAGGRARRLGGRDKTRLPLGDDPEDHCLSRIGRVFDRRFDRTILVLAAPGGTGAPSPLEGTLIVTDRFHGCGPLGGLHAGLEACGTPFAFVCGGDMPSLSGPLIDHLVSCAVPGRLVIPVRDGRPEPLHGVYPRSCLKDVTAALEGGIRMMTDFFSMVPVDHVDTSALAHMEGVEASFENINTEQDLSRVRGGGKAP